MKTTVFRLIISSLLAITPFAAVAQTNIKQAFDALTKCPEAKINYSYLINNDPVTHAKTGECDVYFFELQANRMDLIENAIAAFEKDGDKSYSRRRSKLGMNDSMIGLAIGDGRNSISIDPGHYYAFALFTAPKSEDPDGIYRYAYAISYKDAGNGKITGKFFITFAQTLAYRQKIQEQKKLDYNMREIEALKKAKAGIYPNDAASTEKTWFEGLMTYLQGMADANSTIRNSLATKAYKHIGNIGKYTDVTEADKTTAREILKGMISDSEYSETILNKLLQQCFTAIK